MMHPDTEIRFVSPEIGFGVFATAFIPAGTIVYAADPLEVKVSLEDLPKYPKVISDQIEKYSYIGADGTRIISWDHAKYVNHCCQANTLSSGWGFEIAITNINPNEEITDDYGMFNIREALSVHCDRPAGCRRLIQDDDFDRQTLAWDRKVKGALDMLRDVAQPLWEVLPHETRSDLQAYLDGKGLYKSVAHLRLQETQDEGPLPIFAGLATTGFKEI